MPMCQKCASFSFLRVSVPINVPTAIRRVNFSNFRVVLKNSMWNLCFLDLFCSLVRNEKTWVLHVASNKGFLEFSTAKTTKQNKVYM